MASSQWPPQGGSGGSYTFSDSLANSSGTITLVNDSASPTASQYYGTNGASTLGYYNLPSVPAQVFPNKAIVFIDEGVVLAGPTPTPYAGSFPYAFVYYPGTPVNGASIQFSFFLASGSYTFSVWGTTNNDRGLLDWYVDGVKVISGQDWYNLSNVSALMQTPSIAVSTSGNHTLTFVVNGKNALATSYSYALTKMWFQ